MMRAQTRNEIAMGGASLLSMPVEQRAAGRGSAACRQWKPTDAGRVRPVPPVSHSHASILRERVLPVSSRSLRRGRVLGAEGRLAELRVAVGRIRCDMVRHAPELFAGIHQGDGLADSAQVLENSRRSNDQSQAKRRHRRPRLSWHRSSTPIGSSTSGPPTRRRHASSCSSASSISSR